MKELARRKKYLKIFFSSYAPPKDSQDLPQGLSGETDSNISIVELCFTYSQANNSAPCKAETKTTSKKRVTKYTK